ncbi:TIM barrel protein [Lactobacillus xylocopicola]|uniref:Xylose isomerase-like TIM barrel domain-containing protein n=1 Tax=Lactobacillus xylocopicola TaxID=2976676 RepID=A0ABN6SJU6_9LACO|nr:TIM barrel protein [Lactobacillus xylocopicola]BDR59928.1 hypothetical protein KIM322_01890 [Lactobacillus xylocopicola]
MLELNDFCINRCCAGGLKLSDFVKLANEVGVHNIELRTDIHKGSNFLDDLSSAEFNQLQREYDVHVANISAEFNLDDRSHWNNKIQAVTELVNLAQKIGAQHILFTPIRNAHDIRTDDQKFADLVHNIRTYSDILGAAGINGLVEPLGFGDSSLRFPWVAQQVLQEADAKNFKLIADTFHYYKAQVTKKDFDEKVDVSRVGLIHLSSIPTNKSPKEADDADRLFICDNDEDIMKTIDQTNWFKESNYFGLYSFEPCAPEIDQWSYDKCKQEIISSIKKIIAG